MCIVSPSIGSSRSPSRSAPSPDGRDRAREGAAARTTRSVTLVAYSTPREAYGADHPGLPGDGRRTGNVSFDQSYGASGEQARAVLAGLQGRRRRALARARRDDARQGGPRRAATGRRTSTRGIVTQVGRRLRRPRRQPEEASAPGPTSQAGRRGRHAERPDLRRRQVERHGRLRRPEARPGRRTSRRVAYLEQALSTTSSPRTRARARRSRPSSRGRGDVLLAYENEAIFAKQKNQPVYYVIPKATIQIENPVAVHDERVRQGHRNAPSSTSCARPTPSGSTPRTAIGPSLKSVAKSFSFPVRPRLFTIQWLGRLGEGRQAVLRPEDGHHHEDPEEGRRLASSTARDRGPPHTPAGVSGAATSVSGSRPPTSPHRPAARSPRSPGRRRRAAGAVSGTRSPSRRPSPR